MKLHALILTSLLAVAGCEKTSNVAAMQDEVTGLTNHYKHRFDELSKRISLLEQRGRSMTSVGTPMGLQDVRRLFLETNKRLAELKTAIAQAPNSIATAAKTDAARIELTKLRDELDERFHQGEIEVNAQIDQVEQWLAYVEYRPKVAAAEPPKTEPVPPPTPEPTPEKVDDTKPAGTTRRGSAEGRAQEGRTQEGRAQKGRAQEGRPQEGRAQEAARRGLRLRSLRRVSRRPRSGGR
jgi:hypothetical protein